jgi:hypothetical protein
MDHMLHCPEEKKFMVRARPDLRLLMKHMRRVPYGMRAMRKRASKGVVELMLRVSQISPL